MKFDQLLALVGLAGPQSPLVPAGHYVLSDVPTIHQAGPSSLDWAFSPPYYPTPFAQRSADDSWDEAFGKATEFVGQLTLAEKVNLTSGIGWMMGPCVGNTGDIPRLDFRGLCLQDGPQGVRKSELNTVFPAGVTTGSTFNRELIYERGKAMAIEFKNRGVDILLGPVAGPLGIKAAGGRNWEGFSVDPYLSGVASAETVKGIQDQGVMANAKHWLGNEQEHFRQETEWKHMWGFDDLKEVLSTNMDDRSLHEVYAWPFADMIKAGVGSVMCSYNQVNNSAACQNSYLLNNVLKEQLGFPGFVMSDWGALHSGVGSILSGGDMSMPGGGITHVGPEGLAYFDKNLTLAVMNGTVPSWRLDDMAVRIMAAFYKVGLDETRKEVGPPNFSSWTLDTEDLIYLAAGEGPRGVVNQHINVRTSYADKIALDVAVEGTVLLKNVDNALPLGAKPLTRIGVLGIAAGQNIRGPNCQDDFACETGGTFASGWGSGTAQFPFVISPLEAINSKALPKGIEVNYDLQANAGEEDDWHTFDRVAIYSDVNIIVGGANAGEGFLAVDGNIGDRKNTSLWFNADEQILRAASLNKNNIVIINSVGQVNLEKWIDHPNITAVLFAAPQGQATGEALAQVLFGEANPSGRLPFTIAKDDSHYIPLLNKLVDKDNGAPQDNLDTGLFVDYKYFDAHNIEPRYEFGYGLSYSSWKLSGLKVSQVGETPSEHLPPPPALKALPKYDEELPSPESLLFPKDHPRYKDYLYPYIDDVKEIKTDSEFDYPEGYSEQALETSSLAGGAPGGNPALWETVYTVSAKLTNQGPYDGAYVPQLYIAFPQSAEFPSPLRQLRGFDKLSVEAGKSATTSFDVLRRDISVWDVVSQSWVVQRGTYTVYVGSSSRTLELSGSFTI